MVEGHRPVVRPVRGCGQSAGSCPGGLPDSCPAWRNACLAGRQRRLVEGEWTVVSPELPRAVTSPPRAAQKLRGTASAWLSAVKHGDCNRALPRGCGEPACSGPSRRSVPLAGSSMWSMMLGAATCERRAHDKLPPLPAMAAP
jgi:transposase